jgi:hypothetical protein
MQNQNIPFPFFSLEKSSQKNMGAEWALVEITQKIRVFILRYSP